MDAKEWNTKVLDLAELNAKIEELRKLHLDDLQHEASRIHVWLYDNCPHEHTTSVSTPFGTDKQLCKYCRKYV